MQPFTFDDDGSFKPQYRPSWVREQVLHFNRKLEPHFQKTKMKRMNLSPFAFYRGTSHLFWSDLSESDLLNRFGGGKGTRVWIGGDAHCDNFGSFTDATGRLVYDLNDFDEALTADYQFDLWRLGVSLVLVGRENKRDPKATRRMVLECARGYWREIKSCRWYENLRHAPWDEEQASQSLRHYLVHVRKHLGFPHMLERWTKPGKEGLRFKLQGNPDLEAVPPETSKKLAKALRGYAGNLQPWPMEKPRLFEIEDLVRRLNAGIGSEGHKRYYALVRVKENGAEPYRILDIKLELEADGWKTLPKKIRRKSEQLWDGDQALRVEMACRALARHPDPWLGRLELKGGAYLVRERSPYKGVLPGALLDEDAAYQLGGILARAHCRAKDSFAKKAFEAIKRDKKEFRKFVVELSHNYADQVVEDHLSFRAQTRSGK